MQRRLLTKSYVDSLQPPISGERWIADTQLRGFGVRLWSGGKGGGLAYCVRKTDRHGRPRRLTYEPDSSAMLSATLQFRFDRFELTPDGGFPLSAFLDDARAWAQVELDRLAGKRPSASEELLLHQEQERARDWVGTRLESLSLEHLVDLAIQGGDFRGWSEEYCDRLMRAFDQFNSDGHGRLTVAELGDGSLVSLVEKSKLGPGNLRLLRSLFNAIFWQVHELGGPPVGRTWNPGWSGLQTEFNGWEEVLGRFQHQDFRDLLETVKNLDADWRPRNCIVLCFYLWAPVTRVMTGRWSQIVDGRWWPYSPQERESWWWRAGRLGEREIECLRDARSSAEQESVSSDFWFPSVGNPKRPIRNVDRVWNKALKEAGWPQVPLAKCSAYSRRQFVWINWDAIQQRHTRTLGTSADLGS